MYLLYGKGDHKDMLINLSAIDKNLIPIYTTLDKCPSGDQFEKIRLSANQYVKVKQGKPPLTTMEEIGFRIIIKVGYSVSQIKFAKNAKMCT